MQKRALHPPHITHSPVVFTANAPFHVYEMVLPATDDAQPGDLTQMHYHPCLEIGIALAGEGVLGVQERIFPFPPQHMVVIPPGVWHMGQSHHGVAHWLFIHCPATFFRTSGAAAGMTQGEEIGELLHPFLIALEEHPTVQALAQVLVAEARQPQRGGAWVLSGTLSALLVVLWRAMRLLVEENGCCVQPQHASLQRIVPAMEWIARHYAEEMTLSMLARACALSASQLRRIFHYSLGSTPLAYLTEYRVRIAAMLLRADEKTSVAEIAFAVGFGSLSMFNRAFKRIFGMPPTAWTRRCGSASMGM